MSHVVSNIVEVSEQNSIVNSVRVDDWTDERAIIASNELCKISKIFPFHCYNIIGKAQLY